MDWYQTCESILAKRCDIAALIEQQTASRAEMEIVAELMQRCILTNAQVAQDQAEYQRQYAEYEARYDRAKARLAEAEARREAMTAKRGRIMAYLDALKGKDLISGFDEALWYGTVEQARVKPDGRIAFIFRDGARIEI
ncbi:MAG: hypothetical protein Q4D04_13615 [Clostridia bacterium]|nr:hypothetical protein [Clostridia bacterium]